MHLLPGGQLPVQEEPGVQTTWVQTLREKTRCSQEGPGLTGRKNCAQGLENSVLIWATALGEGDRDRDRTGPPEKTLWACYRGRRQGQEQAGQRRKSLMDE